MRMKRGKDRKGLSEIIITLIMIVLSLVAVGIVWLIVSNVLNQGSEDISSSTGGLYIGAEIKSVNVESDGDLLVKVKRSSGEGDVTGINFIVSDGENSKIINISQSIDLLEEKTFTIPKSSLSGIAFVKEVSIVPITTDASGKENAGEAIDAFEKNDVGMDDLKNYGLIAWWKFDGDGKDVLGQHNGTLGGTTTCSNAGKYGQACTFVSSILSPASMSVSSIPSGSSWTISTWVNLQSAASGTNRVLVQDVSTPSAKRKIFLSGNLLGAYNSNFQTSGFDISPIVGSWHHLVAVSDGSKIDYYVDGSKVGTVTTAWSNSITYIGAQGGGGVSSLLGDLDEMMVFDKALTEEQIKEIYSLKLA